MKVKVDDVDVDGGNKDDDDVMIISINVYVIPLTN